MEETEFRTTNTKATEILPVKENLSLQWFTNLEDAVEDPLPSWLFTYKPVRLPRFGGCICANQWQSCVFPAYSASTVLPVPLPVITQKRGVHNPPLCAVPHIFCSKLLCPAAKPGSQEWGWENNAALCCRKKPQRESSGGVGTCTVRTPLWAQCSCRKSLSCATCTLNRRNGCFWDRDAGSVPSTQCKIK